MSVYLLGASLNAFETLKCLKYEKPRIFCLKEEDCILKHSFLKQSIHFSSIYSDIVSDLNRITRKGDILIPTTDFWVAFLKENQKKLNKQKYYKNLDVIYKEKFNKMLEKNKLPFLKILTEKIENNKKYIIKKRCKSLEDFFEKQKKYYVLNGPNKLENCFIAQEYFEGENISVCGFKGHNLYMALFKKISERPKNGTSTMTKIFYDEKYEPLLDSSRKLIEKLDYKGPFEIEFIVKDEDFKIIEMNPRLWLQHRLTNKGGINLPLEIINNLRKDNDEPIKNKEFIMKQESYWFNESDVRNILNNPIIFLKSYKLILSIDFMISFNYFFSRIKKYIL